MVVQAHEGQRLWQMPPVEGGILDLSVTYLVSILIEFEDGPHVFVLTRLSEVTDSKL